MNRIQVLDCTLRDGGYCNQWKFGTENTKKIIKRLAEANVDIIECGFLSNKVDYKPGITKFTSLSELEPLLPEQQGGRSFVVMMNYGEYNPEDLPAAEDTRIGGIRIAFHKKDLKGALKVCKEIKEKGYQVFVQAMVSLSYTDKEFLEMIEDMNRIEPHAFYIVDSFGMMKRKSLMRLYYLTENNLKESVLIGFHSHNNMQLAYSNAQALVEQQTERNLIIDSCTYGMGRGAGNLNTELFLEYLNEHRGKSYEVRPLLLIIDEILNEFYLRNYWGYSLPNYLSAAHNIHPSYAGYFCDKHTLTIEAMDEIFAMMQPDKQAEFDQTYAETLYMQYMTMGSAHEEHMQEVKRRLKDRTVLLIAPGRSAVTEKERLVSFAALKGAAAVSVNFDYACLDVDYIFTGNLRRFRELDPKRYPKCIITSNIPEPNVYLQTKYYDLLNHVEQIRDNSGMMAVKFLIKAGVKEIILAGFDGYSYDTQENYATEELAWITKRAAVDMMNAGVGRLLEELSKEITIRFLTESKFRSHMKEKLELAD